MWKLFVAPALLAPGFPKIKQWTYAGLLILLPSAFATHIAVGDGVPDNLVPLVVLAIATTSYLLHVDVRVGGRDLATPQVP